MYKAIAMIVAAAFWGYLGWYFDNVLFYIFSVAVVLLILIKPMPPLPPINEFDENGEERKNDGNGTH
jgi:hypothetical protein